MQLKFCFKNLLHFELRWFHRIFLVLRETVSLFRSTEGPLRASALTYYTLFSIVPFFAMLFGIAKGFGIESYLREELAKNLSAHQDVMAKVCEFAEKTLSEAKGGLIAGIGVIILFWTVIKMIGNIENAFNRVWGVSKQRTLFRKFTDYLSFLLIAPLLLLATSSASVFVATTLKELVSERGIVTTVGMSLIEFNMKMLPFVLAWLLFSFLYSFLPNTRVSLRAALFGGIIGGTVYQLLQMGYIYLQMALSRYNVIYGSFSALPLFLVWVYVNWLILFAGVILAYLYQNLDYEGEIARDDLLSTAQRRELALLLAAEVARDFELQQQPASEKDLAQRCNLSETLTAALLNQLVDSHILNRIDREEFSEYRYQPAIPLEKLTLYEVFKRLDELYIQEFTRKVPVGAAQRLETHLATLDKQLRDSNANCKLTDLFRTF